MKIKLDLYHPYELEAFAAFSAAVAAGKAAYDAAQPKDNFGLRGLIARTEEAIWKNSAFPESQIDESAAQTAPVATQENSSVATPSAPEKKTRTRKPKDAPASSVSSADAGGQTDDSARLHAGDDPMADAVVEQAAISTGEERIGPDDAPEVVAQDEADEKAESDAARDPEKPLTLDDVRSALGEYVRQYGMENAQVDGPKVISMVCGEGKVKVSDIPDDKIAAVVSGVNEMTAKNPFQRAKAA